MSPPSILLAPSILAADFARLGEQVREADEAGADRIHVDVMDGHFVPNISMGPVVVKALRPVTKLPLEVHLMIEQPIRFLDAFAEAGAGFAAAFTSKTRPISIARSSTSRLWARKRASC